MKKIGRMISLILSCMLIVSCGATSKMTAPVNEKLAKEESAIETSTSGVLIKVNDRSKGQKDLLDALYLLEKLYGKPVVVTNGSILQNGLAVVRYMLYFEVSESLYSVAVISSGHITSIDTINKGSVILGHTKVSVDSIIPDSNVHKVLEVGDGNNGTGG
jgi:hypothetical protein